MNFMLKIFLVRPERRVRGMSNIFLFPENFTPVERVMNRSIDLLVDHQLRVQVN